VFAKRSNGAIIATLLLTVFIWGGSNAGTRYLVGFWPPGLVGCTRLLCAGAILMGILKWTRWLGTPTYLSAETRREIWWRGSLSLAIYIAVFNWAMHFTAASHVALYLGTAPVWALMWEQRPARTWRSAQRYGAAALAATGVVVLFWPSLKAGTGNWVGELLAVTGSVMWAHYGVQCRRLGEKLSGAEVSAHTMWRAGMLLLPVAVVEVARQGMVWSTKLALVQSYCFVAGGVIAYVLWNNALKHWPTSQVFLFNNLIPLSTMLWSHFLLGELVTQTFWLAMVLIVAGVVLGQTRWEKVLGRRWVPME
jgi:drug/metabolite transporter (DMT)-like permease